MQKYKNIIRLVNILSILLFSCNSDESNENGNGSTNYSELNIPVSESWNISSQDPVISLGDTINNAQWNFPSVIFENEKFIMFLSANVGDFGEEVVPFRAGSSNGSNWDIHKNSLLASDRDPTSIDFNGIESPTVVRFNGLYHMYYTAVPQNIVGSVSIGHATSENGIDWMKDQNNPVLAPSGEIADWNGIRVAEPGAVVVNNKLFLYFATESASGSDSIPANTSSIGLSISSDGYQFGPQQQILTVELPYSYADGFTGYGSPAAIYYNENVHLFYDVFYYNENENISLARVALHHASSADGVVDWIQDQEAIFTRNMFSWGKREIRAPTAVVRGNLLHLWFGGDDLISDNSRWGIGYATTNLDYLE